MRVFFPTIRLRKICINAAILAAALVSQGCTRPGLPADTAVLLVEMPFRNLDPRQATDAVSQKIGNLVHAALVRHDERMRVKAELAESWTIEEHRKFRFKLRKNALFHDGTPVDADAVVQSLNGFRENSPHAVVLSHVTRISKTGPYEILLETDRPQPFLLHDLPIFKVHKREGPRQIGAGRFLMQRQSETEVWLTRFDRFFEPLAVGTLSKLVFRYISDETTRYQLFARGDSNVILNTFGLSKSLHLLAHLPATMRQVLSEGVNYSYLSFNFRDSKLQNLKVRQAIAHAIDREVIRKHRMGPLGVLAKGIVAPAVHEYHEPNVKEFAFDPKKAEALLDEAGYPRQGRWRFKLTFKCTAEKFSYEMVTMLAGQLRAIGIDARLQTVEAATFFADIRAGNFDVFMSRWIGVTNPSIYFRAFHSSQIGKTNRGAYSNAQLDRLIEQGLSESNSAKRREIFSKVQKHAAEDLPYVNLWYWNNLFIGTTKMRNVVMYPNADYLTLAELRIEQ